MVLANDPASSWCRRSEHNFEGKTWESVMLEMQGVVLPVGWDEAAKERLRELAMKGNESVTAYCGRARMIQEEIGVDDCSDESLAEAVVGGTSGTFKAWIKMERVVKNSLDPLTKRFSFPVFEDRLGSIWLLAQSIDGRNGGRSQSTAGPSSTAAGTTPVVHPRSTHSVNPAASNANGPPLSPEELQARNVRFGAYMRSIGLCPRCKTSCNKWLGGCEARPSATFFSVPMEFPRAPPYPSAKGGAPIPPSKPAVPTGGARPSRRVDVATVETGQSSVDVAATGNFPDLGRADLAAYEQLINHLNGPADDDVVEAAEYEASPDYSITSAQAFYSLSSLQDSIDKSKTELQSETIESKANPNSKTNLETTIKPKLKTIYDHLETISFSAGVMPSTYCATLRVLIKLNQKFRFQS
ncbi:uncharacterized protein MELLADRAFT_104855 [Melampsora larici-populina 98AG31]|uniref:Retrotransposon gag domain-containing protein n=1 Tax=Melampsora larici-populina (strain 98AG31 / pathotype 3-4-7) TaxID=747676 RepID=F4RFZ4_MELLP|nr:uncharacterized protein MELLADRAFT_104855 [Melampsora larici-populina 98AG31]EGG08459.1 hypothetical protein MELLADRAFT_104855 [Melampsora larici-populina 98AG31]